MATSKIDANKGHETFGGHPPDCLVCCLRILTPPTVKGDHMETPLISEEDAGFFGPFGNTLHFSSPDDCPNSEMLKLQRKLKRTRNRAFNPEFERWIVQLYLQWAFTASSTYFGLPLTIQKIREGQNGHPDFLCQESGLGYALEVTRSTIEWHQKKLGDKSGPIEEWGWATELQNRWAKHVHGDIIKKTKILRTNYSRNGYNTCDLLLYDFLLFPLTPEDVLLAHKRLIEIVKNDSDLQDTTKPAYRRISIVSEGRGAGLDILGTTPTLLVGAIAH